MNATMSVGHLSPAAQEVLSLAGDGARGFVSGRKDCRILLAATDKRFLLRIEGEPDGASLKDVFQQAADAGALNTAVDVLIDLREFIGIYDWAAITEIGKIFPADVQYRKRVAYLFRDGTHVLLLKVLAVKFPRDRHKAFVALEPGREWLGW